MSELEKIKNLIENLGFTIIGLHFRYDKSLIIDLVGIRSREIHHETIYIPPTVSNEEYNEIFYYVCEKAGIPRRQN